MNFYKKRREQFSAAMADKGVSSAIFSPSSDFLYLTGSSRPSSQRIAALILSSERAALLIPDFEKGNDSNLDDEIEVIPYSDSDNAIDILSSLLPSKGCVAVGHEMHADILLSLQHRASYLTWCCADTILEPIRRRKDSWEIQLIETAQHMAERALCRLLSEPLIGHTERVIASRLAELRLQEGFDSVGNGIVASGPNTALPHHINSDRPLSKGDILMVDIGGTYRGYRADFTRTFVLGTPPEGFSDIYHIVLSAHMAGKAAAQSGVSAAEVDHAARQIIERAGYGSYFTHRLGHGIGLDVHEPPFITSSNRAPLEIGNVFSCEPGIYLPGRFGVRIEDLLVLEKNGARSLNTLSKDLQIISV